MEEFDVIVIGGGMAGLETLAQLKAERVCVLEAGTSSSAKPVTTPQWCRADTLDPDWWPRLANGSGGHFDKGFGLRKRLGGRSLCWHGISLPMEKYAYDNRWHSEAIDWVSQPEMPFVQHQKELMQQCITPSSPVLDGYSNAPILKSASEIPFREDCIYTPLDRVDLKTHDIRLGHNVLSIESQAGQFLLLVSNGTHQFQLRSHIVVFAAGAAMNGFFYQQLMPHRPAPAIQDNIVVGRSLLIDTPAHPGSFALQYRTFDEGQTRIFISIGSNENNVYVDMWSMGADQDSFSAKIENEQVVVDQELIKTSYDMRCRQLLEIVDCEFQKVLSELSFPNATFPGWEARMDSHQATILLDEGSLPHGVVTPFEGILGASDHEHGSVPFGEIDQNGELIGKPGAYFAGPSCFPSLGGTNPTLPTISQCRTTADHINLMMA